jgi:hypothetical protein
MLWMADRELVGQSGDNVGSSWRKWVIALGFHLMALHRLSLPKYKPADRTYDEVAATRTMIERTRRRFDLSPKRI